MKHLVTAGLLGAMIAAGSVMPMAANADEMMDNETVETRQMLMDGIGGAMGTLGCYLKGQCDLPDPVVRNLANGIAFAATAAPNAFEPKTMDASVKTTADEKIWSDWDGFANRFPELLLPVTKRPWGQPWVTLAKTAKAATTNIARNKTS